jgi:hypothetical protein
MVGAALKIDVVAVGDLSDRVARRNLPMYIAGRVGALLRGYALASALSLHVSQ